jgi:hypothetical protein
MSYPIKYPTPQGANIQIFNAGEVVGTQTWIKPQGASFVWFTLIGGGGAGDGATGGGGSGAVTNCMVPAFLIPDSLIIKVGVGGVTGNAGQTSLVNYKTGPTTSSYNLLTANGGSGGSPGTGGAASTSNYFSCMGFFQSIAGQNGSSGSVTPSIATFLSGGGGNQVTGNYGYTTNTNTGSGFFQTQPIIVGVGGGGTLDTIKSGIGCGGAGGTSLGGSGGDGLVVIITW